MSDEPTDEGTEVIQLCDHHNPEHEEYIKAREEYRKEQAKKARLERKRKEASIKRRINKFFANVPPKEERRHLGKPDLEDIRQIVIETLEQAGISIDNSKQSSA